MADDVRGFAELQAKLANLASGVHAQVLTNGGHAGGNVIRAGMQQRAPRKTGFLNSHIENFVSVAGGVVTAKIGPQRDAFYGGIIQGGAKPHPIKVFVSARRARRGGLAKKKALSDGSRIFQSKGQPRGVVLHPGIKPRHWMTDALVADSPRAIQVAGAAMWSEIDKIIGTQPKGPR